MKNLTLLNFVHFENEYKMIKKSFSLIFEKSSNKTKQKQNFIKVKMCSGELRSKVNTWFI